MSHIPQPGRMLPVPSSTFGAPSSRLTPSAASPPASPQRVLYEQTAAMSNARPTSMIAPPGTFGRKHQREVSSSEQPGKHRKTLAQQAGETKNSSTMGPPGSRPMNSNLKGSTLPSLSRQTSFSSSVSSRTPSISTRDTSSSSFSASVGSGRAPSQTLVRPQTSMSNGRSRVQAPQDRPATSLDNHEEIAETSVPGKRKGVPPISFRQCTPSYHLQPGKLRGSYDSQMNYTSDWSSSRAAGGSKSNRPMPKREVSISQAMKGLSIEENPHSPKETIPNGVPKTPSRIPKPTTHTPVIAPPESPTPRQRSPQKHPPLLPLFLTRESTLQAWDTKGRLEDMEEAYDQMKGNWLEVTKKDRGLEETLGFYKTRRMSLPEIRLEVQALLRKQKKGSGVKLTHLLVSAVNELENLRTQLTETNVTMRTELEMTKLKLSTAEDAIKDAKRSHDIDVDDLARQHRNEIESVRQDLKKDHERSLDEHRDAMQDLRRRLENQLEEERSLRIREVSQMSTQGALEKQQGQIEVESKEREIRTVKADLEQAVSDLERERTLNKGLRQNLSTTASNTVTLESSMRALKSKIEYLESDSKSQSRAFGDLQQDLQDAKDAEKEAKSKLLKEETLRRKLHNQVQELKGNIRVFCRVRPALESDGEDAARIAFPDSATDSKEISIQGLEEKSSLGTVTTKTNAFSFDRVFDPRSQNADVFDEISQLVQSALDGYNVCIFCYGQTGSGKTYTMSSLDGMIPRAVRQIYETAQSLEEKGWRYHMEGSFVEVYNENLNDLLGKAEEFDKKKHEIRHDLQKCKTTITDITVVPLDSPDTVSSILEKASSNRSVAATKANQRSSRSHSVFILKLRGENSITGEKSEGTLNLVDLAGSERLSHSGATGDRLKETQNINRSLSCLGDVIGALGQGKEGGHIPYRNSKLTYLLQFSLGGNSKTLMFVMVSPLQAHLGETLTSLKFATKVHNTHIGTAKRMTKVKE